MAGDHLFWCSSDDAHIPKPFVPTDLPGLMVWLDARDVSSPVSTWPDRSGNGYDGSQSVAARQPVTGLATSPTGIPLVSFDGSATAGQEDYIDITLAAGDWPTVANGYTYFFAGNLKTCKKLPAVNSSIIWDGQTAQAIELSYEDPNFTHKYAVNTGFGVVELAAFSSGNQVLTYSFDPGVGGPPAYTGDVEVFRNTVSQGSGAYSINTTGVSNLRLGDRVGGGQPCFMDLAVVLWYRRGLTATERTKVWNWIDRVFGYG